VVAFVSLGVSVGLGGVGGCAAEARSENNPLRGFDGVFVVVEVVGVGEEMTLVMGVDEDDEVEEEAPSAETDCGVTGSGFVRDRVRPLLLFGREPRISNKLCKRIDTF